MPIALLFGFLRLVGYSSDPLLDDRQIHQVMGEPARMGTALAPPDTVKVVSWNIARGARFDGVLEVLANLDADVYLLQEVDWACRRSGYREVARDLADALDMNWVFAGEFQEIGEARRGVPALTGQAILSRYPLDGASTLRFETQANLRWTLDPFQPRRGGRVALRAQVAGAVFYNAHIESARDDRFRNRQVDEILTDSVRRSTTGPLIVAGDLNTDSASHSPVVQRLVTAGFRDALGQESEARQTSVHHQHPLDWIFVKHLDPAAGEVSDHERASDHFPLWATLMIPLGRADAP